MKTLGYAATALLVGAMMACQDGASNSMGPDQGRLNLRLTDAPFPTDSVESIDVFIVRVDARIQATTESEAAADMQANAGGWVTIATPNASFDLMTLRNGVSVSLGESAVPAGTYQSLRLVLDTDQSGVTLKTGLTLTGSSSPSILFPSAGQSGLKIMLDQPIVIESGAETEVMVDFDAEQSFILRGNTILQNGLLFKPVIRASVM